MIFLIFIIFDLLSALFPINWHKKFKTLRLISFRDWDLCWEEKMKHPKTLLYLLELFKIGQCYVGCGSIPLIIGSFLRMSSYSRRFANFIKKGGIGFRNKKRYP